jgi:hypothetical protein
LVQFAPFSAPATAFLLFFVTAQPEMYIYHFPGIFYVKRQT